MRQLLPDKSTHTLELKFNFVERKTDCGVPATRSRLSACARLRLRPPRRSLHHRKMQFKNHAAEERMLTSVFSSPSLSLSFSSGRTRNGPRRTKNQSRGETGCIKVDFIMNSTLNRTRGRRQKDGRDGRNPLPSPAPRALFLRRSFSLPPSCATNLDSALFPPCPIRVLCPTEKREGTSVARSRLGLRHSYM
ncbi:hypothetical protein PUN28_002527 [Cardiocondyla obscurior]|uniref:Uncharacterized protein n=1 Tax=Cardiocondyla obscurior TaxID=286306 RepID=A0AAW2GUX2_9HYME